MVSVDTPLVEVIETADRRTVELARPDKLNALTPELVAGLAEAFAAFRDDPGPGILLTGQGRATCAGLDTDIAEGDYKGDHPEMHENMEQLYRDIESCPAPVAMAGFGALVGAGAVISLNCEFLVLGEETTWQVPEVQYGIASTRTAARLPDLVGRRVATELLLTGEAIDPARAKAVGLATDVVPEDEVENRARELLATVGDHDAGTVAEVIDLLNDGKP